MRGGYREYSGALAPPWASADAAESLTKARCLGFLDAAEAAASSARLALRHEYGGGAHADQLFGAPGKGTEALEKGFSRASAGPEDQLAKRLAHTMLAPAGQLPRRYTVALTGQSNAAGHGSYFDETYPFVLGRAAAAAFNAAGVRLAVQNFAAGGGRTLPTTGWCGEAQLGPSVGGVPHRFLLGPFGPFGIVFFLQMHRPQERTRSASSGRTRCKRPRCGIPAVLHRWTLPFGTSP